MTENHIVMKKIKMAHMHTLTHTHTVDVLGIPCIIPCIMYTDIQTHQKRRAPAKSLGIDMSTQNATHKYTIVNEKKTHTLRGT